MADGALVVVDGGGVKGDGEVGVMLGVVGGVASEGDVEGAVVVG